MCKVMEFTVTVCVCVCVCAPASLERGVVAHAVLPPGSDGSAGRGWSGVS